MDNQNIITNSFKAWILAARPKTLTGAALPVIVALALVFNKTGIDNFCIVPAVLCFLFAIIMQIDANFINDYFDCIKGNDDSDTRLGPKRACSEGWITLDAMRYGIFATTAIACVIGMPLIFYGGVEMILIGCICVVCCFLYTTILSYLGLGDVLVIVFFGIIPVCITYYVVVPYMQKEIPLNVLAASIACGLVIDTLLIINNYRDRDNDKRDGKITLIVRVGEKIGERLYFIIGLLGAIAMCVASYVTGKNVILIVLPLLYVPMHYFAYRKMIRINKGMELNAILGKTSRNMLIFCLLSALSILL
ncbi:MAG: 1,4-dihydroxy-2-naphthoate octaprenyltransferase [Prevotella sp.]|jgi:1,4-dihydroxy-2-naphthoate octaprenyltransferase|nr:1,4-dihydroxy-2-naphthoate octaprenyltransferase [Prevotella sp.]MBP6527291.1 1,4-dihydroxy-2-naphthoate octaprenyltransferase [Prevotella sp.]MBP7097082.1 1,4-dihydroxy-2-naphthoate octaprenyltransferase [Prevotella sp.]MBP8686851.1 1,4-dihydroxy-2-naphthoate octaprenyltransferase [Prevotella sp.]MBP8934667.1 1,4-dihydroxy-2-naphthoate octaprenyltransferase [Prevotella sp.]MBP9982232.1 1,4-dihydroxy-2-naphthoate octaprenyltransferase [Prevotella sp.]